LWGGNISRNIRFFWVIRSKVTREKHGRQGSNRRTKNCQAILPLGLNESRGWWIQRKKGGRRKRGEEMVS